MSSTSGSRPAHWDDLSPQARIRAGAIELFGEAGFAHATVRAIAERAGVSPGLVIHHYGSKDRLRRACDDWVMEQLGREKAMAVGGSLPELQAWLAGHPEYRPIVAYLAAGLRAGGELADGIFDRFLTMTHEVIDAGVAAGTMREPLDREAAAAAMVAWSCGASLLGDQLARRLGGDTLLDPQVYARYGVAALEIFTYGVFTDDRLLRGVLDQSNDQPKDQP